MPFKVLWAQTVKKLYCNDKVWALIGDECAVILGDPHPDGVMG